MNISNIDTEDQAAEKFAARLKQQLDSEQLQLSPSISAKLREARANAIQQANVETGADKHQVAFFEKVLSRFDWRLPQIQSSWLTACASTLAIALVIGYVQLQPQTDDKLAAFDLESDILFAEEDLELYEDLEFYHWLANTGY